MRSMAQAKLPRFIFCPTEGSIGHFPLETLLLVFSCLSDSFQG